MYKKILVTLDGSEYSERVLGHAKAIAAGCNVPEVILLRVTEPILQVYHPRVYQMGEDQRREIEKRIKAEAREYLSQVADRLKQAGIAAETVVVQGQAAEEILNYINNNQVDLVIMSTRGREGVSRWLLGSVTDRVMRHSMAPVLVAVPSACR